MNFHSRYAFMQRQALIVFYSSLRGIVSHSSLRGYAEAIQSGFYPSSIGLLFALCAVIFSGLLCHFAPRNDVRVFLIRHCEATPKQSSLFLFVRSNLLTEHVEGFGKPLKRTVESEEFCHLGRAAGGDGRSRYGNAVDPKHRAFLYPLFRRIRFERGI